MGVRFEDYSVQVEEALDNAVRAFLYEAGGEIEAQTKRNVPSGTWYAQQKSAWQYVVDESKKQVTIGNPLESALWTEFGTGEYSIAEKGGRKGYWVYVKGSDSSSPSTSQKQYTLEEAKKIVAMMRSDGLDAHYTKGQAPKRPFHNAFVSLKSVIAKRAEEVIGGRMK